MFTSSSLRRIGAPAAGLLVVAGLLVAVVADAPAARAVTSVQDGQGYPGDTTTVILRNDRTNPPGTYWTITAPAQTTIVSAASANPPGTSVFPCQVLGGGTSVRCGPSGAGGWAAGNRVSMTLAISAAATAGVKVGQTSLPNESGTFRVTVLAPPAPSLTAPAGGTQSLDRSPTISGTKRAGNSATVEADGASVCSVPADQQTTWSCTPTTPLTFGSHDLTATQTSPGGDTSPASSPVTYLVLEPAVLSVSQDGPRTVIAGRSAEHRITVQNAGPGTAVRVSNGFDGGPLDLTDCAADGVTISCADLTAGTFLLGDLASGGATTISMTLTAAVDTSTPTDVNLTARVSSDSDAASPVTDSSTLTVIGLPAPTIDEPAAGSTTTLRQPRISGTGDPRSTVTVASNGQTYCRSVDVAVGGTWSCRPDRALPIGPVTLDASQTDDNSLISPTATDAFTIVPPAPVITAPSQGARTTDRRPVIAGRALPGAAITVRDGSVVLCSTSADAAGRWSCAPRRTLTLGGHRVRATQAVSSTTSARSVAVRFRVVPEPVVAPAPSPTPPPSGSGNGSPPRSPVTGAPPALPKPPSPAGPAPSGQSTRPPTPTPSPKPSGAPKPSPVPAPPAGAPAASTAGSDPLQMNFQLQGTRILPGTAAGFTGTLGPNTSAVAVRLTLRGTVNSGMAYRSVSVQPGGTCVVRTLDFSCTVTLEPQQSASVQITLYADALNAPSTARQQISVASSRPAQDNAFTSTTTVEKGETDTESLATQISDFPGPLIPLLALFLFALAATETERRHRR